MTKSKAHEDLPEVGVLARTRNVAASLAHELGIRRSVPISPKSANRVRGQSLSVLVVDEELWPLDHDVENVILPTLSTRGGYILRMLRVDPRIKLQERPWTR